MYVGTLHGPDEAVSLLVDQIGDVVDLDSADLEGVPPTLTGRARELVLGAYKMPGRLLLLLDTEPVLSVPSIGAGGA